MRTTAELRAAIADYVRAPRPYVIDVRITREVVSVPYQLQSSDRLVEDVERPASGAVRRGSLGGGGGSG